MIKIGSNVTEITTGLTGMVTHLQIEMNGNRYFSFQPRGLSPENGQPINPFWVVETRLRGGEITSEPKLPLVVLGTEVEDEASGFKGTATALCLHINGCVHVDVQPSGKHPKTGAPVELCNFDIRRLKGKAVPALEETEKVASEIRHPSPAMTSRYQPITH